MNPFTRVRSLAHIALIMALGSGITGCAARKSALIWASRPLMEGAMASLMAETDLDLARTGMEAELKILEGLLEVDPNDRAYLSLAMKGFAGYALLFVEDDDPKRAKVMYERARIYGFRLLRQGDPDIINGKSDYARFQRFLKELKPADLEAVYWTATAWAGRINIDLESPAAIAALPKVTAMMSWVMERDSSFFFSGPQWFFAVYYCNLPALMGGGATKSQPFFERAMSTDGNRFLLGKFLYAKTYAVQTLDRELFVTLLTEVMKGNPNAPRELGLINKVAQKKAEFLLSKADTLF